MKWLKDGVRAALPLLALGAAAPHLAHAQSIIDQISRSTATAISRNMDANMVRPLLTVRNQASGIISVALAADTSSLAVVHADGEVRLWDAEEGIQRPPLRAATPFVHAVPLERGRIALSGPDSLAIYDAVSGRPAAILSGTGSPVTSLAAAGGTIIAGFTTGQVRTWNSDGVELRPPLAISGSPIARVALQRDGMLALAIGGDGNARIAELRTSVVSGPYRVGSEVLFAGPAAERGFVVLTREGRALIFDAIGVPPKTVGAIQGVGPGAVAQDARWAAGGTQAGVIKLRRLIGEGVSRELVGHQAQIRALSFDSSGERLVSADAAGMLRVWEVASGRSLLQMISTREGWAVIDDKGRFDGSQQGMNDVAWQAKAREFELERFSARFFEPGLLNAHLRRRVEPRTAPPGNLGEGMNPPPKVEIDLPDDSRTAGKPFQLVVVAEDDGGGIGDVRLYHNGKLVVPGALLQQQEVVADGKQVRGVAFRLRPTSGLNTFRAVASGRWEIEAASDRVALDFTGEARLPTLWLLTVGVDRYADPRLALNYSVADASAIADLFARQKGGAFERIERIELRNEQATKRNLVDALARLQKAPPEDVIVLYLAGHGLAGEDGWLFFPHEATSRDLERENESVGLSSTELRTALVEAGSQRMLILIDSCYAGAGIEGLGRQHHIHRRLFRELSRISGVSMLGATRRDQVAAEVRDLGHGLLTHVLLQGLGGAADASPRDGRITAHEVVAHSAQVTPDFSRRWLTQPQEPLAFALGADFVLRR
jgi:WD40 repeat protein